MANHGWSVLCVRTIVDRETNQVSLIDAADIFYVDAPDLEETLAETKRAGNEGLAVPAKLAIATWWYRSDNEVPEKTIARLRKINPLGADVSVHEFPVDLLEQTGHRTFFKIPQFALSEFGRYFFVIEERTSPEGEEAQWREVARLPLDVKLGQKPTSSTEP